MLVMETAPEGKWQGLTRSGQSLLSLDLNLGMFANVDLIDAVLSLPC